MSPELQAAIGRAYDVFSRYAKNVAGSRRLHVCRCPACLYEESERALLATPLREIPANLLAEYTNSAHGWDDGVIADEFRYFLPRYLELIAHYDPPSQLGLWNSLCRMGDAPWLDKWPDAETDCIHAFFEAFLRETLLELEHPVPGDSAHETVDIEEALLCICEAGEDVERMLAVWDAAADPGAAANMAYMRSKIAWRDGAPDIHGWDTSRVVPQAGRRVAEFVLSAKADSRIEAAFFETGDPDWQEVLSDALLLSPNRKG